MPDEQDENAGKPLEDRCISDFDGDPLFQRACSNVNLCKLSITDTQGKAEYYEQRHYCPHLRKQVWSFPPGKDEKWFVRCMYRDPGKTS